MPEPNLPVTWSPKRVQEAAGASAWPSPLGAGGHALAARPANAATESQPSPRTFSAVEALAEAAQAGRTAAACRPCSAVRRSASSGPAVLLGDLRALGRGEVEGATRPGLAKLDLGEAHVDDRLAAALAGVSVNFSGTPVFASTAMRDRADRRAGLLAA